ncbi:MAG: hypothetical protein AAFV88_13690 [Planctomycetota bacterium]
MAHQLGNSFRAVSLRVACVFVASIALCGCSDSTPGSNHPDGPLVRVMYQGKPLGDVQVMLHASKGSPVIAQSISRQDGNAYFTEVPSPEPPEYYVTVESVGDGGWMLDPKACQQLSKSISLQSLESSPQQQLEIPNGAVRPLMNSKRRRR